MKALNRVTGYGVLLLALGGFVLSFAKLHAVALRAGYGDLSPIYPALVEGFTTLCTLAAFLRHGRSGAWYPWTVGLSAFGFSLWANSAPETVPVGVVRAVPVVCIPLAVHMWIIVKGLADQLVILPEPEVTEVPEFDTLADMFPGESDPEPAEQLAEVKAEPVKPARKAGTSLADPDTYLALAREAKSPEKRKFWESMAARAATA